MSKEATLQFEGKEFKLPVIVGTEGEKALDVRNLRAQTGAITYDDGFGNTGSCLSEITFIDGDAGVLRYRGHAIEDLAEHSSFVETAYLIIHGNLPNSAERRRFGDLLRLHSPVHSAMDHLFEGFPLGSHPMAILSALLNSLGCYYPHLATNRPTEDLANFEEASAIAISKVRTIAAMSLSLIHI